MTRNVQRRDAGVQVLTNVWNVGIRSLRERVWPAAVNCQGKSNKLFTPRNLSANPIPPFSLYEMDNVTCAVCDKQCKESCYGAGPDKCNECKNVLDEKHCVEECPESKYNNNGVCTSCHATCIGCTGPRDTINEDGCTSCHRAIINSDMRIDRCLARNDSCPGKWSTVKVLIRC